MSRPDGSWSPWSVREVCDPASGVEVVERACDDPTPLNGGRDCAGPGQEERECKGEGANLQGEEKPVHDPANIKQGIVTIINSA